MFTLIVVRLVRTMSMPLDTKIEESESRLVDNSPEILKSRIALGKM